MLSKNQSAEAVNFFKIAQRKYPKERDSYIYLAIAYEQQNSYIEAIDVLNEGLFRLGPNDQLYYNMGNCYFGLKNFPQAAQYYTFTINQNQNYSNAYLNRANAHVHMVKYQDAIDDYTIFLKQKPDDPQREEILKMIELLKKRLSTQGSAAFWGGTASGGGGGVWNGGYGGYGGSSFSGEQANGSSSSLLDEVLNSFGAVPKDIENANVRPDSEVEDNYELEFELE